MHSSAPSPWRPIALERSGSLALRLRSSGRRREFQGFFGVVNRPSRLPGPAVGLWQSRCGGRSGWQLRPGALRGPHSRL